MVEITICVKLPRDSLLLLWASRKCFCNFLEVSQEAKVVSFITAWSLCVVNLSFGHWGCLKYAKNYKFLMHIAKLNSSWTELYFHFCSTHLNPHPHNTGKVFSLGYIKPQSKLGCQMDGRWPYMEGYLEWKTTLEGRYPWMEDDLQWKITGLHSDGRTTKGALHIIALLIIALKVRWSVQHVFMCVAVWFWKAMVWQVTSWGAHPSKKKICNVAG